MKKKAVSQKKKTKRNPRDWAASPPEAPRLAYADMKEVTAAAEKMGARQSEMFFSFLLELFKIDEKWEFDRGFAGFGKKIREIRDFHGLTLDEFAAIIHEHPSQMSMIETGKRRASVEILMRVCMAFHMKPERLLTDWEDQSVVAQKGASLTTKK